MCILYVYFVTHNLTITGSVNQILMKIIRLKSNTFKLKHVKV